MREYRNNLKELFKKYGIHRALRSNTLNDLIDEINVYYLEGQGNRVTSKFHEQNLKEQLNGWVKYLTEEKEKLNPETDYEIGVKDGFEKFIEKLKDVSER